MKVAIIGGGFYGCYIAQTLIRNFTDNISVDIFEGEKNLLTGAATNNQCRLHLGFHYPRAKDTIKQTVEGFPLFKEEFSDCVFFPKKNYYAVRRDGHVSFEEYLSVMDEFKLDYDICDKSTLPYFKNRNLLDGVVRVGEGSIDLQKLEKKLTRTLQARVYFNSLVKKVNPKEGTLLVNEDLVGTYDFIINTTYTNPNLGLSPEQFYETKYELAAMVLLVAPFGEDTALTVMDGNFVSLYPCGNGSATLSSVSYTPYFQCETLDELLTEVDKSKSEEKKKIISHSIIEHSKEFFNFDDLELKIQGLWIAPKCKIKNDFGDTRISDIKVNEKVISVFCGKLDGVYTIADRVLQEII